MAPPVPHAAGNKLGENLKSIRKRKGLTQEELAERSGVPQTRISKYEKGENLPTIGALLKLAAALTVDLNDLVEGINRDYDGQMGARRYMSGPSAPVLGTVSSSGQPTEQKLLTGDVESAGSEHSLTAQSPFLTSDRVDEPVNRGTPHVDRHDGSLDAGGALPAPSQSVIEIIEALLDYAKHLEDTADIRNTIRAAARALLSHRDRSAGDRRPGETADDRRDRGA